MYKKIFGLEILLSSTNVDINATNDMGQTELFIATDADNAEIMNILVKHGADVNKKDQKVK